MKWFFLLTSLLVLNNSYAQEKQQEKIQSATTVVQEFGKMKEDIPQQLLDISQGIIIVPKLINAGFVLAGKRGRGIALVKDSAGNWSNPVFITLTGGTLGLQAGVESVDLILIFKHRSTLDKIGNGSFTLGGDISVAAGPFGRSSSASTDYKLEAEVYSYSRSKGLFAGISLGGSAIDIDEKAIKAFYNEDINAKDLFSNGNKVNTPLVQLLKKSLNDLYK